jgi:hypothetical protein
VAPGSADHARLTSIMMGWWVTLLAASDLDRDNKVTLDEVLLTVDQLGGMSDAVTGTAEAMFEAIDEIFPLLDLDGDGYLSGDEFTQLWTQFWVGDDPDAPGTWVFGRFKLPMLHGR